MTRFVKFTGSSSFKPDPKPIKKDKPKKKTKIKPVSDKRKAENEIYSTLRKVFLNNKQCAVGTINCTKEATEIHHRAGKVGKLFLDVKYFLPVCRNCHSWVELHPDISKEKGYSLNRLDK